MVIKDLTRPQTRRCITLRNISVIAEQQYYETGMWICGPKCYKVILTML